MSKQITVRIPDQLDSQLLIEAKRLRRKRAEIVRIALERYLDAPSIEREEKTPYQIAQELGLIGVFDGPPDLSEKVDEYLAGFGREDNYRK